MNDYKQYAYPLIDSPHPLSAPIGFNYILKTGQLWDKPIKKADTNIKMDLSPDLFKVTDMNPGFSSITREKAAILLKHRFTDFNPQEDIYIEVQFSDIKDIDIRKLISDMKDAVKDRDMKKCFLFSNYIIHQYTKNADKNPYDLLR